MEVLSQTTTERRRLTRNSVYRYLYNAADPRTKQNISEDLSLSLPTVHQNLTELQDAGLVRRAGTRQSTGGRRATSLTIAENARFAVGVSLTEEYYLFLAANLRGEEIAYRKVPRQPAPGAAPGDGLPEALEIFLDDYGLNRAKLLGVGIAVPGIIDAERHEITLAPTLHLKGASLPALTAALPYPAFVSNDANSGGYAEWSSLSGQQSIAYLSLEGGVGGAVLLSGAPYNGMNGRSGEFGHICVQPGGLPCKCGKRGCLEAYCSAARISDDLGITPEDFFAGLAAHNPTNEALWQDYLRHLAIGLNSIRMVLDCNVVLGGFLAQYLEPYLPALRQMAAELNTFEDSGEYIRLCHYPRHAVPLGVALHFIHEFVKSL